jgi:hypothetical protein
MVDEAEPLDEVAVEVAGEEEAAEVFNAEAEEEEEEAAVALNAEAEEEEEVVAESADSDPAEDAEEWPAEDAVLMSAARSL